MSMVPLVLILKRPHAVLFICSQTKSFRLKIVKLCVEQPETHRDREKNRRTLRQTGAKLFICKDRSLSRAGTVYIINFLKNIVVADHVRGNNIIEMAEVPLSEI